MHPLVTMRGDVDQYIEREARNAIAQLQAIAPSHAPVRWYALATCFESFNDQELFPVTVALATRFADVCQVTGD